LAWLIPPLGFAAAGLAAAWGVLFYPSPPIGEGYGVLPVYAAVAAFLVALPCWRLLLRLHPQPRFWSGFLSGLLISLLSYPLTWYLAILGNWLTDEQAAGSPQALNPVEGILAALVYSLLSLALSGWLALSLGSLTGGLLALWESQRRQHSS
jgi:hypothetical protein